MAKRNRTYYEILGITQNASESVIKKAYRLLALRYHPDINHGDRRAEETFKKLDEAYKVLSDKNKKARYDQFLQQLLFQEHDKQRSTHVPRPKPASKPLQKGKTIRYYIQLLKEDTVKNMEIEIEYLRYMNDSTFNHNNHKNSHKKQQKLVISIPAGIKRHEIVFIPGKGDDSINGGPPGDLIVLIRVENSEDTKAAKILIKRNEIYKYEIWNEKELLGIYNDI